MARLTQLKGENGQDYSFSFGTNAMCRAEELTGQTFNEILLGLARRPSAKLLRQFIQATLIEPTGLDEAAIGDVVDDIGGLGVVLGQLAREADPAPLETTASTEVPSRQQRRRSTRTAA